MKRVFIQAGYLLLIFNQIIAIKEVVTINTTEVTTYNTTYITTTADIKNEPHKAEGHIPTIVENSFRSNPSKSKCLIKKY